MKAKIINRKLHRWASLIIALPVIVVVVSGVILQLKKESHWIQPPTVKTSVREPSLPYEKLITVVKGIDQAGVEGWGDVDRLDVRPGKGVIKVRAKNNWEIQLNARTGEVLQVAYRRSDIIESIHDGSFFHESFKLWVFLPSGILLALLWGTGMYLFVLPYLLKYRKRHKVN
jgi:uncharacterized iron-regulated membrane protein